MNLQSREDGLDGSPLNNIHKYYFGFSKYSIFLIIFKFHAYHMYQRSPSESSGKVRHKRLDDLPNDEVPLCQVLKHLKVA